MTAKGCRFLAFAVACYGLLSVVLWWHAWGSDPASRTLCACGDPGLFLWFIEWPAYALAHGLNPAYSSALFHPTGINLLSNTSELALGVTFAPVTWLFGPVVTMNLVSTLAPVTSGLAMCWLLLRWVSWRPAALLGGLLYGFSPFVLVGLTGGHLMLSWLCIPPLVVGCLDELLIHRRRSPYKVGAVLAVLLTIQFFLSTELLAMMVVAAGAAALLLVPTGIVSRFRGRRIDLVHIVRGLGTAVALSCVLLAYPAWFALDGPAHLSSPIWTGGFGPIALSGNTLDQFISYAHLPPLPLLWAYPGPPLPVAASLGIGLTVVLVGGWTAFWRDRKLAFFGVWGFGMAALSLGLVFAYWTPWAVFADLGPFQNVIPSRFSILVDLSAAVMLGLILDHVKLSVPQVARRVFRQPGAAHGAAVSPRSMDGWRPTAARGWVALALVAVVAVALVPLAALEKPYVPLALRPVVVPRWFTTAALRLPPRQVVLPYPAGSEAAMAWQAIEGMPFSLAEGGGPEGESQRAGRLQGAVSLLAAASNGFGTAPAVTPTAIASLRRALHAWGVTIVVVPDQTNLPDYARGRTVAYATALFTAAVGRAPLRQDGALVWTDVPGLLHARTLLDVSTATFNRCASLRTPANAASCILPDANGSIVGATRIRVLPG